VGHVAADRRVVLSIVPRDRGDLGVDGSTAVVVS